MSQSTGVVMLAQPGVSTRVLYNALEKTFGVQKVILETPPKSWQVLQRRIKRLGILKVAGQAVFRAAVVPTLRYRSQMRRNTIFEEHSLNDAPIPSAKVIRVDSVNEPTTRDTLVKLSPRIVVLGGTRIVKPDTLACVPAPFINMHAGVTPSYRGVHGGYWALACGEPEACGVTVHLVDSGIDTGKVLGQTLIEPSAEDNFSIYPWLQLAAGLPLLLDSVAKVLDEKPLSFVSVRRPSKLWYHPTVGEYFGNRWLKGVQ